MKAKLINRWGDYRLYVNETPYATTGDSPYKKLSLKNCQAIERGYDLMKLAEENSNKYYDIKTTDWHCNYNGFFSGFQKALELIGDKKFNEEDVRNIFAKTLENAPSMESHTRMISDEQYRHSVMDELYDRITKSLQQTEWDVEIEMDAIPADRAPNGWDRFPKLDADGYLILKRI
jgi:hypothetical protein